MKTYLILFFIFCTYNVIAQKNPRVSYTATYSKPRLLIFKDEAKEVKDSLLSIMNLIIKSNDSTTISAILSFEYGNTTYSFWKIFNYKSNIFNTIKLIDKDGNFEVSKNIDFQEQEIIFAFNKTKLDVFRNLLYVNGEYDNILFKDLFNNTRGHFGLLNISKLANELKGNADKYKVLTNE